MVVLAFFVAVRALVHTTPVRMRPWPVLAFAVAWAYAAGWLAHVFLNDDPCIMSPQPGDLADESGRGS